MPRLDLARPLLTIAVVAGSVGGGYLLLQAFDRRTSEPKAGPAAGVVVFEAARHRQWDIFAVHADGSGLVNLTEHPFDDTDPAWSPDGRRIAFVRQKNSGTEDRASLVVMDVPSGSFREVAVADGGGLINPVWSPDGSQLAFSVGTSAHVVPVDGSAPARALAGRHLVYSELSWSPDGTRLVFSGFQKPHTPSESRRDVFVVTIETDEVVQLTADGLEQYEPRWSPTGEWIAFGSSHLYRDKPSPREGIELVRPDGSERHLIGDYGTCCRVVWNPDGRRLAVIVTHLDEDGYWTDAVLGILGVDGSLSEIPAPQYPSIMEWSPDGDALAFQAGDDCEGGLFVTPADGSVRSKVSPGGAIDARPDWGPPTELPVAAPTAAPTTPVPAPSSTTGYPYCG